MYLKLGQKICRILKLDRVIFMLLYGLTLPVYTSCDWVVQCRKKKLENRSVILNQIQSCRILPW